MASIRQLRLPKLGKVKRTTRANLPPQPRVEEFRQIRQYEIFHRPFDLKFRGRISKWISKLKREKRIKLTKILNPKQRKLLRLYFFPRGSDKHWLNQAQVLKIINKRSKKKLKRELVRILIRIWNQQRKSL